MRNLFTALLLMLALVSCSKQGYDQKTVDSLMATAAVQQLDEEQTARLIEQNAFAFADLRDALLAILNNPSDEEAARLLADYRADSAFVAKAESAERMWRLLVSSRMNLTEANRDAMEQLEVARRIVDMLNDDVADRLE